ncbi:DUF4236 domain-containing protein [Streptomyces sp. NPDC002889]|uniref:DUF4236 domain-containing protein n=1 Tax=Streptomyces sp. NPDC002889 TaxID=3364669 RepID=UPI0036CDF608
MPITFRKSFRIFPGVRLNLNRKSISVTVSSKAGSRTWSTNGRTTTSHNLPGPFGYRKTETRK